ncbi:hypothetical protein EJ05DRAFT_479609 [Pseudovirgaria hyperparasitica]|uniref:Rhodopsin domain-containing protein n=1 Tax=Pseudovirgaria hyperparasitica TaxID=470096 RepID=A0A6A6VY58_9PEZI|nr:uncharacterized protein EJ05DRAFT_479609 [Pseudovirgaria hyperparasitica]KAF2754644.1 hypothetical protein EJ05DRAFT_479609 [Pseudovirgaria hyperparasitica]
METNSTPVRVVSPPPFVSRELFMSFSWGGTAMCTVAVICRLIVRWSSWRKLMIDDVFVVIAWFLLLGSAIIWQLCHDGMFRLILVSSGVEPELARAPGFVASAEYFLRGSAVFLIFLYTGLWSIKISFLLFFRQLGLRIRYYQIFWWAITALTIATWTVCIGTIQFECLLKSLVEITGHCNDPGGTAIHWQKATFATNCTFDVVTDALITMLPISLIWNVKINLRKKFILAGLFSLVVVTVTIAIVRIAMVYGGSHISTRDQPEVTWLYFWSMIEFCVALFVVCIGSFRTLFSADTKRKANIGQVGRIVHQGIDGIGQITTVTGARLLLRRGAIVDESYDLDTLEPFTPLSSETSCI